MSVLGFTRFLAGEAFGYALIYSGTARLYYRARVARGELTAFYFHNPSADLFRSLVQKSRDWGVEFVSAETLYGYLKRRDPPRAPVVFLSADDGWRNNLKNVAQYAEQENIPVCYFISTEALESGEFWWCRVKNKPSIHSLKRLPNHERKAQINTYQPIDGRVAMTSPEVRHLSTLRHATIGNHTHGHPILPRCADAEVQCEITQAHIRLTHLVNKAPFFFAYPNGDFDSRSEAALTKLGYAMAFTTEPRGIRLDEPNLYCLPRFSANEKGGFAENFCRMIGLWQALLDPAKRLFSRAR